MWYWHKDRHRSGNRIESPEINPYIYSQLSFGKSTKAIHWGKDSVQQVVLEQLNIYMQKINLDPHNTPYTKSNSKWVIDLNVRVKTITLLEESTGENLQDLGLGKDFLDMTPKA